MGSKTPLANNQGRNRHIKISIAIHIKLINNN